MIQLSNEEARNYVVAYHGFGTFPPGDKGIAGVFDRLQSVQIDPINICGRNHEHVLRSRIPGFSPSLLEKHLYKTRTLVEGWEKQASIHKMTDWPVFSKRRRDMRLYLETGERGRPLLDILPVIRQELETRGPLSSLDIEHDAVIDWRWAPAKASRAALDAMYDMGDVLVSHRINNRKVYALAGQLIPQDIYNAPDPFPDDHAHNRYRILRRIRSTGLIWNKSGQAWLDTCGAAERKICLDELCEQKAILEVHIEGIMQPCFIPADAGHFLTTGIPETRAALLAPLDNMLWDRAFIRQLFGFDYCWEVYKPAHTRIFGYYVLPVLINNRFAGRIEPVYHKQPEKTAEIPNKRNVFKFPSAGRINSACNNSVKKHNPDRGLLEIRNWWREPEEEAGHHSAELIEALKDLMRFLDTDSLIVHDTHLAHAAKKAD